MEIFRNAMVSATERLYYARQCLLPQIGTEGQMRLHRARVLVVGAGGLGCPVLLYLATAGVGHIGIADGDAVALHNLHRQVLYRYANVGQPKAVVAAALLKEHNPFVKVAVFNEFLTPQNAQQIVADYDLVIDCTDRFDARYLINDVCTVMGKPFIYGAIHRFEGHVSVFNLHANSPTYRCLFPEPPAAGTVQNCAQAGVMGTTAGLIGLYQANEAIKVITQAGQILDGKLLIVDLLTNRQHIFSLPRQTNKNQIRIQEQYPTDYQPNNCSSMLAISPHELYAQLQKGHHYFLLDVREPEEFQICHIGGSVLIPMHEVPARVHELPQDTDIVVICHHGIRSAHIINYLEAVGHRARMYNLEGGLDAWAREVDPSMPTY
ncbi:MAG: molybdopterin-synthase adenylyltransferase MoeB [Cytophagales bacterium]|nr:molybdopterin-synthase adenylyltransferase MoeB [Bernardetiaceae bacterium]MDW8204229.1 molybdopterin-synthase adenylyltransferase MoeB [Cytophagales bacterium]